MTIIPVKGYSVSARLASGEWCKWFHATAHIDYAEQKSCPTSNFTEQEPYKNSLKKLQ